MRGKSHYNLRKNIFKELNESYCEINDNYKYFKNLLKKDIKIISPALWLLDNIYLIEKEYSVVKKEMNIEYFKGLPYSTGGKVRIFEYAKKYILSDNEIVYEELVKFINDIQKNKEDKPFTMGELWAFPLMMRCALIIDLEKCSNNLFKEQEKVLLDKNKAKDSETINSKSIEKDISRYINSIRSIPNINWKRFFSETSYVESILNKDPANIYRYMDFETKDYYRHKIEDISRVTEIDEVEVAKNALDLATENVSNFKEYADTEDTEEEWQKRYKSKGKVKIEENYRKKEEDYRSHIGYYLIDSGASKLKGRYYTLQNIISPGLYVGFNIIISILLSFLICHISRTEGIIISFNEFILSILIMIIPINQIIISITNWIVSKTVQIRLVPKMDYSKGIPYKYKTIVVIPSIVKDKERIEELMEKLEVEYCGNKDENVYFALLNDFEDSKTEYCEGDSEIIDYGLQCTEKLNQKYCKSNANNRFFFLNRKRIYNPKQKVYMGRERKRGKIMEFIALIKGSENQTYEVISSKINVLRDAKYLITLDEDTFMKRETVYKLVGAMSHILNIPHIKDKRVIRGYGIMQPKVSISLESKNQSHFSKIFAGANSVDGYSVAYSDIYEDVFAEGSFVGKGILDIDEFYSLLNKTIQDNSILSHDLLEGAICRCALVSDVEFIDDYPSCYEASCKRLHRWVRGDWQLLFWLFSKKITTLNKWKIFSNLQRSLLAPNLLAAMILALTILKNKNSILLLCFLAIILPLVFTVTDFVVTPKNKLMGSFKTLKQILLIVTFIPYEAFLMMDAIILTLFRLIVSRRNLLEWQSFKNTEKLCNNTLKRYIKNMWIAPIMSLLIIYFASNDSFTVMTCTFLVALLWFISPYIAYFISIPTEQKINELTYEEKTYLRKLSRRIYAYYEDFINKENNYLPPDNYQLKPYKGVAHRTSPTNIGMGVISEVIAYDLGYITMGELINKTTLIVNNMKSLKKVNGHFLNWYDTRTKEPLYPRYVSTVDSGNLLANLWVLKETLNEIKEMPVIRTKEIMSLKDIYRIIEEENKSIKISFSSSISLGEYTEVLDEIINKLNKNLNSKLKNSLKDKEIVYWLNKLTNEAEKKKNYYDEMFKGLNNLYSTDFLEGVPTLNELLYKCKNYKHDFGDDFECTLNKKVSTLKSYIKKIDNLIKEIDKITDEMDFKFLYDENKKLFSIGYNVEENSLGSSYYDLLASESRIASFVAIAKDDVNSEHWFKLSRAMTNAFHTHALVSWSGTMFEYFMPSLLMKRYPDSLLSSTYKDVIKAQINFAKQKKIPWGISECAFYNFDNDENYQYKAFGIPGLGLKRGLEDEIVVSPYSTIMALPFSRKKCIKNLKKLESINALGRYGFIDAIDYTKARQDKYIFKRYDYSYTQNVDKYVKSVDKYKNTVDKTVGNFGGKAHVNNVDNVNKIVETNRKLGKSRDKEMKNEQYNPQNYSKNEKSMSQESYPQKSEEIFNDNIRPNRIITFMVHHLGMSLMALENTLMDNLLIRRFHNIPQVKASELLLKEKIPQYVTYKRNDDFTIINKYIEGKEILPRTFSHTLYESPQISLMSNGKYSMMINNYGSGYSKLNDMFLYRWKGNSTSDDSGSFIYIKNLNSNDYWSATFEPCKEYNETYEAQLNLDKCIFSRKDGNIETRMEITVDLEENFEVKKITLTNSGHSARSIELTSYLEVVLASFAQDISHPAFSNLFIQTEYEPKEKVLLGSRRARVKNGKVPYIYHKIVTDGTLEGVLTYETSRINFIGRNRTLKEPVAMDSNKALENTVGTVLDPILSMRARIRIQPFEKVEIFFITGTAEDKEEALEVCKYYSSSAKLNSLFNKYHNEVQLMLKALDLTSEEMNQFLNLSSNLFYICSNKGKREEYTKNISKYQKDLWAYSISGDLPIIFVEINSEDDIKSITDMLKYHYYLSINNIKTDLIIYNDEEFSYDEPLQKSIMSAINLSNESSNINKNAGVFLYNKSTMTIEVKELLIGICRIYLKCSDGTLLSQIENAKEEKDYEEIIKHRQEKKTRFIEDSKEINSFTKEYEANEKLDFYNGYGGFSKEDNSYIITLSNYKNTPAPWINVISNKDFGFHISESGSGYTWCQNSRENKITPWSNDYIKDPISECLYIRDNKTKKYFSITPKPVRDSGVYKIKHSFGYSEFTHTALNIKGISTVFVPRDESVKIQIVSLENLEDSEREISLFYYAKLVLGVYEYDSIRNITTSIVNDDNSSYISGVNPYSEYFGKLHAYLTICRGENISFSGDNKEFLGIGGEISAPQALYKEKLSNRCGSIYEPILSCSVKVILKPKEKREFVLLLGQDKQENISSVIEKYSDINTARGCLEDVKKYWDEFLNKIQVKTPSKSIDYMLNGWLLYQTLSCRYLSRSAFYQSGGAYGYRDQLQDSMALGVVDSNITKSQIVRSASRQYLEGDVQHWYHPIINSGIRTRFSDDLLWLPYVTAEYIKTTGDYSILEESAPYLEDEPLKEGEDERYTIVNTSSKTGSIYEHCIKSIEKSLRFGAHNIPLMGSGDWNDGMSTVGNQGRGESVWLGWFLYSILDRFVEIAEYKNDTEKQKRYIHYKNFIKENIEKNAWDGGWYLRAYFDDGTPLGSRENPECQIDSLAQSWSIISEGANIFSNDMGGESKNEKVQNNRDSRADACDTCRVQSSSIPKTAYVRQIQGERRYSERAIEAMKSVDSNLVKEDRNMILLLAPPFNDSYLEPGYIKGYVPGVRENGGQYTHAAVWVVLALTKLGLCNKATKYYEMLAPISHTRTELECMTYKLEPYVMAADVYIKEPHGGRGGWSWYTGASGWMYKVGIENIIGLRKVLNKGYEINPCVPYSWDKYSISIKNEKEEYDIKVIRKSILEFIKLKKDNNINKERDTIIFINDKFIDSNLIPRNMGKIQIKVYFH